MASEAGVCPELLPSHYDSEVRRCTCIKMTSQRPTDYRACGENKNCDAAIRFGTGYERHRSRDGQSNGCSECRTRVAGMFAQAHINSGHLCSRDPRAPPRMKIMVGRSCNIHRQKIAVSTYPDTAKICTIRQLQSDELATDAARHLIPGLDPLFDASEQMCARYAQQDAGQSKYSRTVHRRCAGPHWVGRIVLGIRELWPVGTAGSAGGCVAFVTE